MPLEVEVSGSEQQLAIFAEVLLEEGILREEDWLGTLCGSIQHGLVRWVNVELGCERLQHFDVSLAYTDDIDEAQMDDPGCFNFTDWGWVDKFGQKDETTGCFILTCATGHYFDVGTWGAEVFVGTQILALERLCPGAGWSVFALVQEAVDQQFFGATPVWGDRFLEFCGYTFGEDASTEADEDGGDDPDEGQLRKRVRIGAAGEGYAADLEDDHLAELTRTRFRRAFPEQCFSATWDPKVVKKALRRCRGAGDACLRETLQTALELAQLGAELDPKRPLNEWGYFARDGVEVVNSVTVRWSEDDELPRLIDDYFEHAQNCCGLTTEIFVRGFQLAAPETIRTCVRGLGQALRILAKTDHLLELLHQPTRLVGILADRKGESCPEERSECV
ncbi:MAG: hypothetical protein ACK47B_10790 [Armatimonadota bacterium]